MSRRVLVASWDARRPTGSELRLARPEFKGPRRWLVRLSMLRASGQRDEHSFNADGPCELGAMFSLVQQSIEEMCRGTPAVYEARMEFFA